MKCHSTIQAVLLACLFMGPSSHGDGIPEPSLVLYGSVLNLSNGQPLGSGQVTWQITNQTDSILVSANIVGFNNQFFYVAFIPLETRNIGTQTFSAASNTLGISFSQTSFARTALVNGTNATIFSSSRGTLGNFTLASTDRGLVERVDLEVGTTDLYTAYLQWLTQYGLPSNTPTNADYLGKGMTYWQQFIAGTDPTNKNSVFEFVDIRPDPKGLNLIWTSFTNRAYTLEGSDNLGGGFSSLQQHILASPPSNSFLDTNAYSRGQRFYRVRVE